jgi:hypothetical protein
MFEHARSEQNLLTAFVLLGLGVNAACLALWQVGDLIWVDFLHTNPDRTQSHALTMIALSPFNGMLGAVSGAALPVLCGAMTLTLGCIFYGRIPIWFFMLAAPICGMAAAAQVYWMQTYYGEGSATFWTNSLPVITMQVPFLLTCWWWITVRPSGLRRVVAI